MHSIEKAGFKEPTPIQCIGFPIGLSGHNMVGVSRTGSGKTLSFLLPSIVHICAQDKLRSGDGPIAVVLLPTRELAQQVSLLMTEISAVNSHKRTCLNNIFRFTKCLAIS